MLGGQLLSAPVGEGRCRCRLAESGGIESPSSVIAATATISGVTSTGSRAASTAVSRAHAAACSRRPVCAAARPRSSSRTWSGRPSRCASAIAAPPSSDSSMPSSTASSAVGAMSLRTTRRSMNCPNACAASDSSTRLISSLSSAGPGLLRSLMSCNPCAPKVRIFSHNCTLGEHEPCGLRNELRLPERPRGTAHRASSRPRSPTSCWGQCSKPAQGRASETWMDCPRGRLSVGRLLATDRASRHPSFLAGRACGAPSRCYRSSACSPGWPR
jgi:hypothetical protein